MRRQVVPRRLRSFPLIIDDDVSQNTLSAFIGAFIYSVVALVAPTTVEPGGFGLEMI